MTRAASELRNDKKKQSAVLFFARDFLATEFPCLAAAIGHHAAVYVTTTRAEARTVFEGDPSATVFVLQDYIRSELANPKVPPTRLDEARLRSDRFVPRLKRKEQVAVVVGLEDLLADIGKRFNVRIFFDEPVSGYLNDRITEWVRTQGGMPCHFHTAWLPNHIFFTRDNAQREPIPLNLISDGETRVLNHIENRKQGSGRPLYVLDFTRRTKRWSTAAKVWAKGLYRLLRRDAFYMNRDPWPHFFNAKCLLNAATGTYAAPRELEADAKRIVVMPLHYEPEAVLGYLWDGGDQVNLAVRLLEQLPSDRILVVKEHPSQPGALTQSKWRNILKNPQVRAMRGADSLETLLASSAILFSIGSTAVLEAVRLKAPAFVVGHPHFAGAPGVTHVPDFATGPIPPAAAPADEAALIEWYGAFLNLYCVEGRFMRGNTELTRAGEIASALMEQADGY